MPRASLRRRHEQNSAQVCRRKRIFLTWEDAEIQCFRIAQEEGEWLYAYGCLTCGLWHLAHMEIDYFARKDYEGTYRHLMRWSYRFGEDGRAEEMDVYPSPGLRSGAVAHSADPRLGRKGRRRQNALWKAVRLAA